MELKDNPCCKRCEWVYDLFLITCSRNKFEFQSNAANAALVIIPEGLKTTIRMIWYNLGIFDTRSSNFY